MLQKRNDFEIIEELRKNSKHIRELAEILHTVPSTILRTIKKLEEENIVDFKEEGKNKKYFLKKTPEAKTYLLMTEHYKLLKILQQPKLRNIIKKIQEETTNELIIMFGSYAKGIAKEESDIDIFIQTTNKQLKENITKLHEKINVKIGTLPEDNPLTKEIIKNHVIIKNTEQFYESIQ